MSQTKWIEAALNEASRIPIDNETRVYVNAVKRYLRLALKEAATPTERTDADG
jgi:hypothetical protein